MAGLKRPNIRLNEACDRYIERIKNEGQSERSIYTAYYILRRFRLALSGDPLLHTVTTATMDDYCFGAKGIRRGVSSNGFNRYRSVLKMFFDYALLMRWIDTNPMDAIGRARPDTPKPRLLLSAGELLRLLDNCATPIERVACALGMNTGLRGNDIRHLTVMDANLPTGLLQASIHKTKKLDQKPITLELHFELMKWLNEYADLMGCELSELHDDWYLVPSFWKGLVGKGQYGIRPYPTVMYSEPWKLVKRPLERMGFETKGEGFHTLRRSSARALFESLRDSGTGRDHALMIVKDFLNHTNTAITEVYLGLNQERAIRDTLLKSKPFLSVLAEAEQQRVDQPKETNGEAGCRAV